MGRDEDACKNNIRSTCDLLEFLGFKLNVQTCNLEPRHKCKFLGFIFNRNRMLSLTKEKIHKIANIAVKFKKIIEKGLHCKTRDLAKLCGVLVSACPAVKYG